MLEKMFTTNMSMDKKKLQNRFSKIRSKTGKTSKFIAMAVFAIIIIVIICVSIWIAVSRQDDMILYENEAMNFKLEIPLSWQGKFIVDKAAIDDNYIVFKHKKIAEKHEGMGTLLSVIKLPDSEIDEYMNMVGNMTVIWRNQDYGYLIGRPTDVQVPIFASNDEEDIKLSEEYQKMYNDVSHIETTFSLINDVDILDIVNAENLSYRQIMDLQKQVNNGHFPWRLDYEQVIKSYLSGKGYAVEDGSLISFAGDSEKCSGTYAIGNYRHHIELFKPIDKTEHGIWIVQSYELVEPVIIKEVSFYNINSEDNTLNAEIKIQEDGWYVLPSVAGSFVNFDGVMPESVTAYFTPAGTNTEKYKKVIGFADPPFQQIPISVALSFAKNDTMGHLQFEFTCADGSTVKSKLFNVLVE